MITNRIDEGTTETIVNEVSEGYHAIPHIDEPTTFNAAITKAFRSTKKASKKQDAKHQAACAKLCAERVHVIEVVAQQRTFADFTR